MVPLMLEASTRVTRGETRVLFMSGSEGGREPGGICFARPLRRELSTTCQKLGEVAGAAAAIGAEASLALADVGQLWLPRNPRLSKSLRELSPALGNEKRWRGLCRDLQSPTREELCGAGKLEPWPHSEHKGG